jgi:hypothetical protein
MLQLYQSVNFEAPHTSYRHPPNEQLHVHWTHDAPHITEAAIPIPRVRELGFRLARHDIIAASRSMLSFVMEPGEGEREEGYQGNYDEEFEDRDMAEYAAGHGYESYREQEVGYDREEHMGVHEDWCDGNDEGAMAAEDEGEIGPRRRQKARKPRRPYTVTMALRKTNWFESSMDWEDDHFRVVYR